MKTLTLCQPPECLEAEVALHREQPYPPGFTLADRTAERMARARKGLAHVMVELVPQFEGDNAESLYCWLSEILTIIEITRIDAEADA